MALDRMTITCFGATYTVAFLLELFGLLRPGRAPRIAALIVGTIGVLAHTLYLTFQAPAISSSFGSMLFLAWILAIFYVIGSIHHRRQAWGVFVLPVILALVFTAAQHPASIAASGSMMANSASAMHFWRMLHLGMLLMAAVGVCVAFVSSLMYLVQAQRLRDKSPPSEHPPLLSLERLEAMNRRGINLAFPLLTAGVLIGAALWIGNLPERPANWSDPKILGTLLLWLLFATVIYLRYGIHLRGRQLALLTIVAFCLLVFTLTSAHTSVRGGLP